MGSHALRAPEELNALMKRNPDEARKALETLLTAPLRFTPVELPEGKRYRIEGEVGLEAMFATEEIGRCTTGGVPSGIRNVGTGGAAAFAA